MNSKIGNNTLEVDIRNLRGRALNAKGHYRDAIEEFESGITLAQEIGYNEGIASCSLNLSVSYKSLRMNDEAIETALQAYTYARRGGLDSSGALYRIMMLVLPYDPLTAIEIGKEALLEAESRSVKHRWIGSIKAGIGHCFVKLHDFDTARKWWSDAESAGIENRTRVNILRDNAYCYAFEGRHEEVEALMKEAELLLPNVDKKETLRFIAQHAGNAVELKQFELALEYSDKALDLGRQLNITEPNHDLLRIRGMALGKVGRFEEGWVSFQSWMAYEHLGTAHLHHRLTSSRVMLAIEEGKKELEKEKQGSELQRIQMENMERELSTSAIHLASQTDLLDRFQGDLRNIIREIDEPIAALKKIKEKLKELPCSQIDWTKFEAQFNEVHPEFRRKLAEKYPTLTEMEQRIAVMVRMDLKSSDIARLFCITERAVEFHRLNLRKKLELMTGDALPKFLQGI